MKISVINGPNLNMLGKREPTIYGTETLEDISKMLLKKTKTFDIELEFYQSNHEGDIVDKIQSYGGISDGIILNAAAYTHTSIAIRDAIAAINIPVVEVHLSNVNSREEFRKISYISSVCKGVISGFGANSYYLAVMALYDILGGKYE
ncbi:MAG: type II 3-dehydroquinate dehydratase [Oscillospiraceae bacterium]